MGEVKLTDQAELEVPCLGKPVDRTNELRRYAVRTAEDDPTSFHGMELNRDGDWVSFSQATTLLAAKDAEIYLLRNERDNLAQNVERLDGEKQAAEAEVKRLTEVSERLTRTLFDLHEAVDSEIDVGAQSSAFRKRVVAARATLNSKEHFECPINQPSCSKNCGSYGCGN